MTAPRAITGARSVDLPRWTAGARRRDTTVEPGIVRGTPAPASAWRMVSGPRGLGVAVRRLPRAAARLLPPAGRGGLPRPVSDYKAPGYWLDYRCGFVRRGLPGEVLRRATGGTPTYRQMERTAVGLSRAAALSIVPIAVQAGFRAPGWSARAVATGLLVSSPLTCTLHLHDVGRYDAVGVLALALLSSGRSTWLRLPLPVSSTLLAGAVSIAVASEEFLLAVLAPTALVAADLLGREHRLGRRGRRCLAGGLLGPGAAVAAASLLARPPEEALAAARAEAARAGAQPPGPMGDALSALGRSYVENLAFFRLFRPAAVARSCAQWAGFYFATARVLGRVLGGGGLPYRLAVAAHAVVAAVLSTAGTDFRRWWGLALTGLVSTLVLLEPDAPGGPVATATLAAATALAVAGLTPRNVTVHPRGPISAAALGR